MITKFSFILTILVGVINSSGYSQSRSARSDYIDKYADLAVKEMKKSGIPASITMAQAVLESSDGRSDLAITAKNHFGIKCHTTWTGRRYYYNDDAVNECFRAYKRIEESFKDHSLFLMNRSRYAILFELDSKDYKGWAKGLKAAGYATNPGYAKMLIKIIEDNNLDRLDNWITSAKARKGGLVNYDPGPPEFPHSISELPIYTRNRIKFVIADPDDSIDKLTKELKKFKWEIRKYNEIPRRGDIIAGQVIYLQPKRKKAAKGYDIHYAEEGESWYSIAQHYGVRLKWLYKRNDTQRGTPVEVGQVIFLRGHR